MNHEQVLLEQASALRILFATGCNKRMWDFIRNIDAVLAGSEDALPMACFQEPQEAD